MDPIIAIYGGLTVHTIVRFAGTCGQPIQLLSFPNNSFTSPAINLPASVVQVVKHDQILQGKSCSVNVLQAFSLSCVEVAEDSLRKERVNLGPEIMNNGSLVCYYGNFFNASYLPVITDVNVQLVKISLKEEKSILPSETFDCRNDSEAINGL
jgi:hypothetical protein